MGNESSQNELQWKNGFIAWEISTNLLKQFKNAKHHQEFQSPQFTTIDGTIWRIAFYPRGYESSDICSIYLQCVKLSATNQPMGVCYSFNITEIDWSFDGGQTFEKDEELWGLGKAFEAEKLNDLQTMSVQCFVEEAMNVDHTNTYFEWKVNQHWMQKWKNASFNKMFVSPQFKSSGAEWYLRIYPNGKDNEGVAYLDIRCRSIECNDEKEMDVCHYIDIEALNHYHIDFDGETIEKNGWVSSKAPFTWNDIQKQEDITIRIKTWRAGAIEENELLFASNLYSEKIRKVQQECSETIANLQKQITSLRGENDAEKAKSVMMRDINNGFMHWTISQSLLHEFLNAKHKQVFYSPPFKTPDETIWRLQCYPRGSVRSESPDECSIALQCALLNASKSRIGVNYSLNVMEMDWCKDSAYTFRRNGHTKGLAPIFASDTLNNFKALNIKCFVEETMDVSDGNTTFEWKVNNHLIEQWKNAKYKKGFISPLFNAIGAQWFLQIHPNGRSTKGTADLYICCRSIKSGEKEINVCHSIAIEIEGLGYSDKAFHDTIKKHASIKCNSPFKLRAIQKECGIIMCITICETGSHDTNEVSISKLHDKQNTCIVQNNNHKQHNEDVKEEEEAKGSAMRVVLRHTVVNLKSQLTALQCEHEALGSKLKVLAMSDLKKQQEIVRIKQEHEEIKAKHRRVAMTEIKSFEPSQEISIDNHIVKKQQGFDDKILMNEKRLHKWKADLELIKRQLKYEEKDSVDQNTEHVLKRFMECKILCDQQELRMDNVFMHCTELNEMAKILKKERKRCNEIVREMDKDCQHLKAKYQTLQAERTQLQLQWTNALGAMNRCIDEENKTNDAKCCAEKKYIKINREAQQWNLLSTRSVQLINQYQLVDTAIAKTMAERKQMFDILWDQSMKHWFKWTPNDIICWLKYLKLQNELTLSNKFNFDSV
eukprot:250186_1